MLISPLQKRGQLEISSRTDSWSLWFQMVIKGALMFWSVRYYPGDEVLLLSTQKSLEMLCFITPVL